MLNPYTGKMMLQPLVQITSEVSKTSEVQTYNIYAGRNMIHGIDRVLSPKQAAAGAATPSAVTATGAAGSNKVTTEGAVNTNRSATLSTTSSSNGTAAAGGSSQKSPSGRRLQHVTMMLQPIKALEIGTTQTDAAAVAVGKTLAAITAAATGNIPVQYPNRFGSFGIDGEADACLNCSGWVKGR